jgi:antitoxin component of MazEF toxin-antitoxin module
MKARITRGTLVLDPPLLEELGIDENGEVEISRQNGAIVLRPVRQHKLDELLAEMDEQYGSVFKRLAE